MRCKDNTCRETCEVHPGSSPLVTRATHVTPHWLNGTRRCCYLSRLLELLWRGRVKRAPVLPSSKAPAVTQTNARPQDPAPQDSTAATEDAATEDAATEDAAAAQNATAALDASAAEDTDVPAAQEDQTTS